MEAFGVAERLLQFLERPEEKILHRAHRSIHPPGYFLHLKPIDSSQYDDFAMIGGERCEGLFQTLEPFTAPDSSARGHLRITLPRATLELELPLGLQAIGRTQDDVL